MDKSDFYNFLIKENVLIDSNRISLIEALKEKVFGNDSSPEELEELAAMFVKKEYSRRQTLVGAGERWEKVFFIHRGIIRLFYTTEKGKDFNKGFFCEGEFVWPIAPSARKNNSLFNIAALENITLSICSFTSFHSWLIDHGYWKNFALPYAESFAEEKIQREYEFLTKSAAERFRSFCTENPMLSKRIPDYHLATYLGITNVSLSRIKKC